jgi:hypothetical protein
MPSEGDKECRRRRTRHPIDLGIKQRFPPGYAPFEERCDGGELTAKAKSSSLLLLRYSNRFHSWTPANEFFDPRVCALPGMYKSEPLGRWIHSSDGFNHT